MRTHPFSARGLAFLLGLSLVLPSPASALRPLSAGLEDSPVRKKLEASLGAGLETDRPEVVEINAARIRKGRKEEERPEALLKVLQFWLPWRLKEQKAAQAVFRVMPGSLEEVSDWLELDLGLKTAEKVPWIHKVLTPKDYPADLLHQLSVLPAQESGLPERIWLPLPVPDASDGKKQALAGLTLVPAVSPDDDGLPEQSRELMKQLHELLGRLRDGSAKTADRKKLFELILETLRGRSGRKLLIALPLILPDEQAAGQFKQETELNSRPVLSEEELHGRLHAEALRRSFSFQTGVRDDPARRAELVRQFHEAVDFKQMRARLQATFDRLQPYMSGKERVEHQEWLNALIRYPEESTNQLAPGELYVDWGPEQFRQAAAEIERDGVDQLALLTQIVELLERFQKLADGSRESTPGSRFRRLYTLFSNATIKQRGWTLERLREMLEAFEWAEKEIARQLPGFPSFSKWVLSAQGSDAAGFLRIGMNTESGEKVLVVNLFSHKSFSHTRGEWLTYFIEAYMSLLLERPVSSEMEEPEPFNLSASVFLQGKGLRQVKNPVWVDPSDQQKVFLESISNCLMDWGVWKLGREWPGVRENYRVRLSEVMERVRRSQQEAAFLIAPKGSRPVSQNQRDRWWDALDRMWAGLQDLAIRQAFEEFCRLEGYEERVREIQGESGKFTALLDREHRLARAEGVRKDLLKPSWKASGFPWAECYPDWVLAYREFFDSLDFRRLPAADAGLEGAVPGAFLQRMQVLWSLAEMVMSEDFQRRHTQNVTLAETISAFRGSLEQRHKAIGFSIAPAETVDDLLSRLPFLLTGWKQPSDESLPKGADLVNRLSFLYVAAPLLAEWFREKAEAEINVKSALDHVHRRLRELSLGAPSTGEETGVARWLIERADFEPLPGRSRIPSQDQGELVRRTVKVLLRGLSLRAGLEHGTPAQRFKRDLDLELASGMKRSPLELNRFSPDGGRPHEHWVYSDFGWLVHFHWRGNYNNGILVKPRFNGKRIAGAERIFVEPGIGTLLYGVRGDLWADLAEVLQGDNFKLAFGAIEQYLLRAAATFDEGYERVYQEGPQPETDVLLIAETPGWEDVFYQSRNPSQRWGGRPPSGRMVLHYPEQEGGNVIFRWPGAQRVEDLPTTIIQEYAQSIRREAQSRLDPPLSFWEDEPRRRGLEWVLGADGQWWFHLHLKSAIGNGCLFLARPVEGSMDRFEVTELLLDGRTSKFYLDSNGVLAPADRRRLLEAGAGFLNGSKGLRRGRERAVRRAAERGRVSRLYRLAEPHLPWEVYIQRDPNRMGELWTPPYLNEGQWFLWKQGRGVLDGSRGFWISRRADVPDISQVLARWQIYPNVTWQPVQTGLVQVGDLIRHPNPERPGYYEVTGLDPLAGVDLSEPGSGPVPLRLEHETSAWRTLTGWARPLRAPAAAGLESGPADREALETGKAEVIEASLKKVRSKEEGPSAILALLEHWLPHRLKGLARTQPVVFRVMPGSLQEALDWLALDLGLSGCERTPWVHELLTGGNYPPALLRQLSILPAQEAEKLPERIWLPLPIPEGVEGESGILKGMTLFPVSGSLEDLPSDLPRLVSLVREGRARAADRIALLGGIIQLLLGRERERSLKVFPLVLANGDEVNRFLQETGLTGRAFLSEEQARKRVLAAAERLRPPPRMGIREDPARRVELIRLFGEAVDFEQIRKERLERLERLRAYLKEELMLQLQEQIGHLTPEASVNALSADKLHLDGVDEMLRSESQESQQKWNDQLAHWEEIARLIERFPKIVFTTSAEERNVREGFRYLDAVFSDLRVRERGWTLGRFERMLEAFEWADEAIARQLPGFPRFQSWIPFVGMSDSAGFFPHSYGPDPQNETLGMDLSCRERFFHTREEWMFRFADEYVEFLFREGFPLAQEESQDAAYEQGLSVQQGLAEHPWLRGRPVPAMIVPPLADPVGAAGIRKGFISTLPPRVIAWGAFALCREWPGMKDYLDARLSQELAPYRGHSEAAARRFEGRGFQSRRHAVEALSEIPGELELLSAIQALEEFFQLEGYESRRDQIRALSREDVRVADRERQRHRRTVPNKGSSLRVSEVNATSWESYYAQSVAFYREFFNGLEFRALLGPEAEAAQAKAGLENSPQEAQSILSSL